MSRRAAKGYLLVAGSFLIMGLIGVLVDWATAPESALLVLRFATAGLVLGVLFARRHPLAGVAARSVWPRLLLMGVVDSITLLLFFIAIRWTGSRSPCSSSSSRRSGWRSSPPVCLGRPPSASSTLRSPSPWAG